MNTLTKTLALAAVAATVSGNAALADGHAGTWMLDTDASNLTFGSIKNNDVGEIHTFEDLAGTVSADGAVDITIDLASVSTLIDIRNERMIEHLFGGGVEADLSAQIDLASLEDLPIGDTEVMELDANLAFLDRSADFFVDVAVTRLGDHEVMVTSNSFFFIAAWELGFEDGLTTLAQLASLDGITGAAPVSFRFVFSQEDDHAAVTSDPTEELAALVTPN